MYAQPFWSRKRQAKNHGVLKRKAFRVLKDRRKEKEPNANVKKRTCERDGAKNKQEERVLQHAVYTATSTVCP